MASSSWISPNTGAESGGAIIHDTVPGDGRGFFDGDGVKKGEDKPVCFLGVTGVELDLFSVAIFIDFGVEGYGSCASDTISVTE